MIKKKVLVELIFTVFILVLLVPDARSFVEATIYSGTVNGGDQIESEGYTFLFTVAEENAVFVEYDLGNVIIPSGECRVDDDLEFCAGPVNFSYRNVTTFTDIYKADVDITLFRGFEINKTVEKTSALIGEKNDVIVRLINGGIFTVEDAAFKEVYPISFRIENVEGCFLQDNKVIWGGTLGPNAKYICKYTLIGEEGTVYKSRANMTYTYQNIPKNATSDSITITVKNYSLDVKMVSNFTATPLIGDAISINFLLDNIHSEEISVHVVDIIIPSGFEILKRDPDLKISPGKLSWSGKLSTSDVKNFSVVLKALRTNPSPIKVDQRYTVKTFLRDLTKSFLLEVGCDCIQINHNNLDALLSGKPGSFRVELFNPSPKMAYSDIKLDIKSNIPDAALPFSERGSIEPKETVFLFGGDMQLDDNDFYYYNISLSYLTELDELITEEMEIVLIKQQEQEEEEEPEELILLDELISTLNATNTSGEGSEPSEDLDSPEPEEQSEIQERSAISIKGFFSQFTILQLVVMFLSTATIFLVVGFFVVKHFKRPGNEYGSGNSDESGQYYNRADAHGQSEDYESEKYPASTNKSGGNSSYGK